jgi:hypothetical protein
MRLFYTLNGEPIRRSTDIYRHSLTKAQKKALKRDRQRSREATINHTAWCLNCKRWRNWYFVEDRLKRCIKCKQVCANKQDERPARFTGERWRWLLRFFDGKPRFVREEKEVTL